MAKKKKRKSRVNQAGNYTKPTRENVYLRQFYEELKVGELDNGAQEKRNYLQENIKQQVVVINNGSQEIAEKSTQVDKAKVAYQIW